MAFLAFRKMGASFLTSSSGASDRLLSESASIAAVAMLWLCGMRMKLACREAKVDFKAQEGTSRFRPSKENAEPMTARQRGRSQ